MTVAAVRDLHPVVRDEAYWIGHETLVNAFHHGQGKHVEMEIVYDRSELRLRFRDDGCSIASSPFLGNCVGAQKRARRVA